MVLLRNAAVPADNLSVKKCPGCDYLVPDEWDVCRRCCEPLGALAPQPEPAQVTTGVPAASGAVSGPVSELSEGPPVWTAPPRPAPQPATFDPPAALEAPPTPTDTPPPVRPAAFGGPPRDVDGDQWADSAWTSPLHGTVPAPAPERRRVPPWAPAVLAVVVALLSAWFVRTVVFGEDVPEGVSKYADGTQSVPYTSVSSGYSIELPTTPVEQSMSVPVMGLNLRMELALSQTEDLLAGVVVMDLPAGSGLDPESIFDSGAFESGSFEGAEIESTDETTHQGYPAIDVVANVSDADGRLRAVIVGDRAYVAVVAAKAGSDVAFEHLVETFQIGA